MAERKGPGELLFEGADWDFDMLRRVHDAIDVIAREDLGLDFYPNQIEIISSEQMLDAYSSIGMPLMYRHWSFGKHFIQHEQLYRKGMRGLAYEIVINSDPCISYCLEENTIALQALVIAHAAFGHNHFFKNNHLFRQWTDAEAILPYLEYARNYVRGCEEKYGRGQVERLLDSAHALMPSSVFRRSRPPQPTQRWERQRQRARLEEEERSAYYLWDTLPGTRRTPEGDDDLRERKRSMRLPEENLLYFVERYSPALKGWQREVLSIVRDVGQYLFPQKQTQVMNEGCACFVHFYIVNKLHQEGRIDDGAMLEILHNHTNVLTQPGFDDRRFGGINPYTLGFAMMQDIRRICEDPTEEDREWFPTIAGAQDWRGVLKDAWENYRDESFILQYLSPKVIRDQRLFVLDDEPGDPWYTVSGIHDERGYRAVRDALARSRDISFMEPDIRVTDVDLSGDRVLHVQHVRHDGIPLDPTTQEQTRIHLQRLWGHQVVMHAA